jgi:hypothetical protein
MKRRLWLLVGALGVTVLGLCSPAQAVEGVDRSGDRNRNWDRKPSYYYVLMVKGASGDISFETVSNMDYRDKMKGYEEELAQARKDWAKAKRDAEAKKDKYDAKPPVGPVAQKIGQAFKKEEDAKKFADKKKEEYDKAMEKKQAKEGNGKEEPVKKEEKKKEGA